MKIKYLAYSLTTLTILVTITIGLNTMPPYSLPAIGFIVWSASPYILMLLLIKLSMSKTAIISIFILSILVSLFGLGQIINVMYINHDAQGGLVYLFTPLWQWLALLILVLPILLLNKIVRT